MINLECQYCGKKFNGIKKSIKGCLKNHEILCEKNPNLTIYICEKCKKEFKNEKRFKKHKCEQKEIKKTNCKYCRKENNKFWVINHT